MNDPLRDVLREAYESWAGCHGPSVRVGPGSICWRAADAIIAALAAQGVTLTREPGLRIEHDARMQDALDALQTATLWVNGSWPAPSEQAAESWRHKARSGIVALRAALASEDRS